MASDLLITGEAKPYDAIWVGRRGVSYLHPAPSFNTPLTIIPAQL